MIRIDDLISIFLGLPKTLYLNFKYLSFQNAIKFPILVSHRVLFYSLKGNIIINAPIRLGMIRIGFGNVAIFDKYKLRSILHINGDLIFFGKAIINHGSKLSINKGGQLLLGKNFTITAESQIICNKKILFGDNCLISWDNLIMDTDFHTIKDTNGIIINEDKEIEIGNNVWIGCRCSILKGSKIGNNVVVAANSNIYKNIEGDNQIIGENPTKIIKKDIIWEK